MSNVSHISSVDRGLKMKIKRTNKVGSSKNESKLDSSNKIDSASSLTNVSVGIISSASTVYSECVHSMNGVLQENTVPKDCTSNMKLSVVSVQATSTTVATSASLVDSTKAFRLKSQLVKEKKTKEKSGDTQKDQSSDNHSNPLTNGSNPVAGCDGGVIISSTSVTNGGGVTCGATAGVGGWLAGADKGDDISSQTTMVPQLAVELVGIKQEELRPQVDDPYEFNAKVEDCLCLPQKKLKTNTKVWFMLRQGLLLLYLCQFQF